jgi:hypothetical protein
MIWKLARKNLDAALPIRDYALSIMRRHGRYQSTGSAKFQMWHGEYSVW